jgi:hypothetical protein
MRHPKHRAYAPPVMRDLRAMLGLAALSLFTWFVFKSIVQ